MKLPLLLFSIFILPLSLLAQITDYSFAPNSEHPFGLPNPEAPPQILDWAPLIGECDCISVSRKPDQSWGDPVDMVWRFKYIMNGRGVQDETLKADGVHSGSIRQYNPDSALWYVHYYSSGGAASTLPTWEGNKTDSGNIVLYRDQKAPNGMEGMYKITFYEISEQGFKWLGEWVNPDETISYPTWKIDCSKRQPPSMTADRQKIMENVQAFSQAYMNGNREALVNAYTTDGKIFPGNRPILEGREALSSYWQIPEGQKILHHKIMPEEIKFMGNYAWDYGYYEGKTQQSDGSVSEWKGKYVIVWQKVGDDWKMYLDIWNRVPME